MSLSKLQNATNRINWLQDILNEKKNMHAIEAEQLQDAKSFCSLEIDSLFTALSYNTLKSCLKTAPNDHFRNHTFNDNWSYFLSLREKAYSLLLARAGKSKTARASDTPIDYKLAHRNALRHANLCANAYLQLRRDVQGILKTSGDLELDYKRLEKTLKKSWSTYKQIISSEPDRPIPKLTVVKANT